ncbi:MAG TPA: S8 family serine peptidase [Gemmatimonadales bacterium]|nr:S8 family serine peptidase [Gemmatimonadales bacterium]HRZ09485.1 S8 family serine peptidase [Gemmatimonadales bacterium]
MQTRSILLAGALALGCAPAVQQPQPNIDPGRTEAPVVALPADSVPPASAPVAPADAAYARGWMPLAATGVTDFLALHPEWDGRGVLIGILDSGIDAGVPGLQRTPNGSPKLLDLRDFSHEGAVPLTRVDPAGDTVRIGGVTLGGMSRVRTLNAAGPWYGGLLHERPLGEMPAADVNGDGDDADSLAVLVTQASDGWVVLVDSDGDGSLAGERPVRDYLHGRDTFGWAEPGQPSPLTVAVNIAVSGGVPSLDLFFDTSGHGTHVAGIAAGNDMYGVGGFDGVAPGAQLLGLKIANNAHGGVTVTGSMLRAMDYAIRFAKTRNLPLVLNMSFGVGNEVEGTARMDAIVDSVLAANPGVVMAISAGNDGPGLSTLGFPGSADRALTVGATFPLAFLAGDPEDGRPDPVAYFSSRGGELAKPDIVTPGVAYSTVPRFNIGDERKGGTSMASPHAAGLLALLRSGAAAERMAPSALQLKQALMVTARPLAGATYLDQGTGTPNVGSAWTWLSENRDVPEVRTRSVGAGGGSAAFRRLASTADTTQRFQVERPAGASPIAVTLRSDAPWLVAPARVQLGAGVTNVDLRYRPAELRSPGMHVGVVTGWGPDTLAGPLFRLVNTVIVPVPADTALGVTALEAGATERVFFAVDSGRPFSVRVASGPDSPTLLGALHAPKGRPGPDENVLGAGPTAPADFVVDAADARPGLWEADALASPVTPGAAAVAVRSSPVRIGLGRNPKGVELSLANLSGAPATLQVGAALVGAERGALVPGSGSREESVSFTAPAWATELVVDADMPAADWARFTDFAVTLYDAEGRIVAEEPMNYADVRLRTELPESPLRQTFTLRLTPAFADSADTGSWTLKVRFRLLAAEPVVLDVLGSEESRTVELAPGKSAAVMFQMPASPWPLPDGFFPLGQGVVMSGDQRWTRTAGLPVPIGPVMR